MWKGEKWGFIEQKQLIMAQKVRRPQHKIFRKQKNVRKSSKHAGCSDSKQKQVDVLLDGKIVDFGKNEEYDKENS